MSFFKTLKKLAMQKRIESRDDAMAFLESRAAYVVQKSITEYSQARANMMFSTLLGEKDFKAAYENARWQGYPAALSMVAEVLAGAFRQRLGVDTKKASNLLLDMGKTVIAKMEPHATVDTSFWPRAAEALEADLARATLAEPRAAHAIARNRAREVFEALPFHSAIRQHDFSMFRNTLSFHLAEIATELEDARLEPGAASGS